MTNWADEIANKLTEASPTVGSSVDPDAVAAALRKAKADGMREAADYVHSQGSQTIEESDNRYADWAFLKARADAIEKGTNA